jgi:selenocysteine-specific elongation factor
LRTVRRFLIGTAGHIDHGKTALVRALTGIDADRLPEERRRGITIDLGFAHAQWEGVRVSFVDVPGHERFVRNMLAGAGGIDAVLLVVAADESVMPQTREHLEIVRLLGVERGVVAVTKSDRVTPEMRTLVVEETRELLRGTPLEACPIIPVSSVTGEGLDTLRAALLAAAQTLEEEARAARPVRLPIDRAFAIAGFGPVVTGSLVSGSLARDQRLELLPEGRIVRARRVEVHGQEVAEARAGERTSVNLAGVELSDLSRGQTLATPGHLAVSRRLTVRLSLLPGAPRLESGDRLSFHLFASDVGARVRVLDGGVLAPGGSARAQLWLAQPVAAIPGDKFVVRRASPAQTVGGGVVLDPLPRRVAGKSADRARVLDALESSPEDRLMAWIEEAREAGAADSDLARRSGLLPEEVSRAVAPLVSAGRAHLLRRAPDRWISDTALRELSTQASKEIAERLRGAAGAVGVSRRTLMARLLPDGDPRWAEAVEAALVSRGVFAIAGEEARPPGRDDIPSAERELSERIAAAFRQGGLEPPSPADVVAAVRHHPKVVEGLIGYLVKKGTLVRLPGGWIVAKDAIDDVTRRLRASGKSSFDVSEFKETFGLTRKLAIPLLEYLDMTKVTRRVGDRRELLP